MDNFLSYFGQKNINNEKEQWGLQDAVTCPEKGKKKKVTE